MESAAGFGEAEVEFVATFGFAMEEAVGGDHVGEVGHFDAKGDLFVGKAEVFGEFGGAKGALDHGVDEDERSSLRSL